jgi:putative ABC transport system ATP-binding protein
VRRGRSTRAVSNKAANPPRGARSADGLGRGIVANDLFRFFHAGDDDETVALRGVSLTVAAGEIVAVTGPSGSGKSTLLACLAGLDDPDAGVVMIDGERISRRSEVERTGLRARLAGVLFQSNNLVPHLTVAQNVSLARRLAASSRGRSLMDTDSLLGRLGIARVAHAYPSQLSGGESAKAGLAVALANAPSVLLADEPTGELDRDGAVEVLSLLRDCARDQMAVVVVTHDADIAQMANRTVSLRDGSVV